MVQQARYIISFYFCLCLKIPIIKAKQNKINLPNLPNPIIYLQHCQIYPFSHLTTDRLGRAMDSCQYFQIKYGSDFCPLKFQSIVIHISETANSESSQQSEVIAGGKSYYPPVFKVLPSWSYRHKV